MMAYMVFCNLIWAHSAVRLKNFDTRNMPDAVVVPLYVLYIALTLLGSICDNRPLRFNMLMVVPIGQTHN